MRLSTQVLLQHSRAPGGSVFYLEADLPLCVDTLHWVPLDHRKGRTEGRMSLDQLLESALHRLDVQRAQDTYSAGQIVGGALRRLLLEQPERLLAARERIERTAVLA